MTTPYSSAVIFMEEGEKKDCEEFDKLMQDLEFID